MIKQKVFKINYKVFNNTNDPTHEDSIIVKSEDKYKAQSRAKYIIHTGCKKQYSSNLQYAIMVTDIKEIK